MDDIIIEQDLATGTSYWTLSDAPVDHSRRISDLVTIDLDAHDQPVGIEFAMRRERITYDVWASVFERFPHLKETLAPRIF